MLESIAAKRLIQGVKAGAKAKAQGADTKVSVAKAVNAATGINEAWVVKGIDITIEYGPVAVDQAKVLIAKAKVKFAR